VKPLVIVLAIVLSSSVARGEPLENRPQVQLDLGLAVVGADFEHHLGQHVSLQLGAQLFSTYFAPWFDVGDKVVGFGGEIRPTYFLAAGGRGVYVAPFLRVARVGADDTDDHGIGFSTGAWAGYAFGLGKKLDLRVGVGAQYMRYFVDTPAGRVGLSTPFVALDLVVGYRL